VARDTAAFGDQGAGAGDAGMSGLMMSHVTAVSPAWRRPWELMRAGR
jgi:hypothetical protein